MTLSFTWFDYVVLAILFFSVVMSFFRGFLREALSLVTWVFAILLGIKFAALLSLYVPWVESETIRYIVAFIVIFLVIFIIGSLMARALKTISYALGLGIFDHILGFVFGLVRGGIAVVVLMMLIMITPYAKAPWYSQSTMVNSLRGVVAWSETFLPKGIQHVNNWIGRNASAVDTDQIVGNVKQVLQKVHQSVTDKGQ